MAEKRPEDASAAAATSRLSSPSAPSREQYFDERIISSSLRASPLLAAADTDSVGEAKMLLAQGANINFATAKGIT